MAENAAKDVCHTCPIGPAALRRYGHCLGIHSPEESLLALAKGVASSPCWSTESRTFIVARPHPEPILAFWGQLSGGVASNFDQQAAALTAACRHLRWVSYPQAERDAARLAAGLRAAFGSDLDAFELSPVPRGGFLVAGLLAYCLGLAGSPWREPEPAAPLLAVDDCALSGQRSLQVLERFPDRQVVFAHLYSPAALRRHLEAQPRVLAALAARDLRQLSPEDFDTTVIEGGDQLQPTLWHGRTEVLGFPWSEPDRKVWNRQQGRWEKAWHVLPPELCLRHRASEPAAVVQLQGRPAGPMGPSAAVIQVEMDGLVHLAHLDHGQTLSLDPVGSDIWRGLFACGDPKAVSRQLAADYTASPARLSADVESFCERLQAAGFLGRTKP